MNAAQTSKQPHARKSLQAIIDWRVFYANTGGALRMMREILPRMAEDYGVSVGYL